MIMEEIYGGLTGGQSVHLSDWPQPSELPEDANLVIRMDQVREAASTALRLREDAGLRVRLPLSSVTIAGHGALDLREVADLLSEEINVHEVILSSDIDASATLNLRPNGNLLGPRLGAEVQKVFAAAKKGEWQRVSENQVEVAGHLLESSEFDLMLEPTDPTTTASLKANDAVVILDTEVTPELEAEGSARDLIRLIQQSRKDADLEVTDRIFAAVEWSPANLIEVKSHEATILAAVLANHIEWLPGDLEPKISLRPE